MKSKANAPSRRRGREILWGLLSPHKYRVAALSVVSLLSALMEALFIVLLTGLGMTLVSGHETVGPILGKHLPVPWALAAAASSLALRVIFSLVAVSLSTRLSAGVTIEQRQKLSHAYLQTSWDIQHAEPSGRLQELLTTFVQRISHTVSLFGALITASLSLAAFLATGFILDPGSTGAVIIALAVVSGILTPLRRAIRRRSRRSRDTSLAFASSVAELGSLGMEMQTFGATGHFESLIDRLSFKTATAQRRTDVLSGALPHIYMSLAYAAVLAGVAILSVAQTVDLAVIGAVIILMIRAISYGQQLVTATANMNANLPFLEGVAETIAKYVEAPASQGTEHPESVTPVEATELSFEYTPGRTALEGVDFRLSKGEAIGVIGPSGAGKSTLAQLLLSLRTPTSGRITAAGVPLERIASNWWTKRVAFVPQDANLFTGTVAENIRFFRYGITDEGLEEAARQANVLSDIEALPNGFDTHLGERGSQLSGGQRQRVSIARALAGSPEFLVLDEPTSALDGQSEALIRETLTGLRGSLTVVIIAHRMSTLDICDRIMVIEDGHMTDLAVPNELLERNVFYRNALAVAGIS